MPLAERAGTGMRIVSRDKLVRQGGLHLDQSTTEATTHEAATLEASRISHRHDRRAGAALAPSWLAPGFVVRQRAWPAEGPGCRG